MQFAHCLFHRTAFIVSERAGHFLVLISPESLSFAALPQVVTYPTRQRRPIVPQYGAEERLSPT